MDGARRDKREKEPECLAGRRPADILLLRWTRGQHVTVDFVCKHPAGPAQYPLECTKGAKHCNRAEASKLRENQGLGLLPLRGQHVGRPGHIRKGRALCELFDIDWAAHTRAPTIDNPGGRKSIRTRQDNGRKK